MGAAIGQLLPYAIAVSISPIPMIAVVLMLSSKRGAENGLAFLLGAAIGLIAIGGAVLVLAGDSAADANGKPADSTSAVNLALGVLLIILALRSWRKRPQRGEEAVLPKWMDSLDHFTPVKSLGLALSLSVVNFKNLLLTIAAATAIAQSTMNHTDEAIALAVFVVIGLIGPATPVAIYFAAGDQAEAKLSRMKDWLAANNAAIMAILLLLIGAKLLGDAITGLSS
jgi:threonine/homoserine/homoserine lactone efflux protein